MCYCYNAPPSILKRKKAQREPVAPWKKHSLKMSVALSARPGVLKQLRLKIVLIDEFEGARSVDGAACAFLSVLRITWTKTEALHFCACTAGSYYIQCVFAYVCFLVWVTSSCTADLVCVIAVENTNLANTSKAVCHFGTALLGAPLTHWTSQHFSLFTVAHAKPPLHLKSLQHVVNSLPKGNLHFFSSPPQGTACQKYKRRKLPLHCCRRYCVWYFVLFAQFNWQASSSYHFLPRVFREQYMVVQRKRVWA